MAKPKLEIGYVVRWDAAEYQSYVAGWQRDYGREPMVVVEMVHYVSSGHHPKLKELNGGKPVKNGEAIHRQVFVKDEFLTAAYKATQQCQKKTPSE